MLRLVCTGARHADALASAGSLARIYPPPKTPLIADAYGLVLRHEEGWSLVYSGDTQPSQQLVQVGSACTPGKRRHLSFAGRTCGPLPAWASRASRRARRTRRARQPGTGICGSEGALTVAVPPLQAGRGATLLIHEATFEPCLEQQARQKRHSTTAEALEVARVRRGSAGRGAAPGCAA